VTERQRRDRRDAGRRRVHVRAGESVRCVELQDGGGSGGHGAILAVAARRVGR
jgi:hypothetical protein